MFQCSHCKTGAMNTPEQYLTHIHGTKHKKKAFALQAPFSGIEYEEYRHKTTVRSETFVSANGDFPSLSENTSAVNGSHPMPYVDIKDTLTSSNNPRQDIEEGIQTNGECRFDEVDEEFDERPIPTSIDDVFFKRGSRKNSALFAIESYTKNNKTASAALNEISVAMYWCLEFVQIPAENKKYGFMVRIDGFDLISGEGGNKKEARQHASSEAIKVIRMKLKKERIQSNHPSHDHQVRFNRPRQNEFPADAYCRLTIEKLLELENLRENQFVIPRRYAAFIITDKDDQLAIDGAVVAFGAGTGVLKKSEELNKYPGYYITNFDSLVLAKRSFQCFLYNQLTLIFDRKLQKNKTEKVYFDIGKNGKVKLRDGSRIHLFMSHAPSGDSVESLPFNWTDPEELSSKELDRDKNGILDPIMLMTYNTSQFVKQPGHIRVLNEDQNGGWMSLVDFRNKKKIAPDYMVMSPTDKLTAWIHCGVQGALLSHLMDPVHLYSIQVAKDYMHEHFTRAIICRVPLESLMDSPSMDSFKDPYIARVSKLPNYIPPLLGLETRNVSYNWYSNPVTELPEIIDNETGLVHQYSPFKLPDGEKDLVCSRLAKVCMLVRLKQLLRLSVDYYALRPELQRTRNLQGISDAAGHRYNLFKNSAIDYRSLKQTLFQSLNDKRYGDWAPNNSANNFDLLQYYDL